MSKSVQQYEVIRKDERHVGLGSGAAGIVFWTGDLNCEWIGSVCEEQADPQDSPVRLDQTDEVCRGLIKDKEYGLLLKKVSSGWPKILDSKSDQSHCLLNQDQLNIERALGRAFKNFEEASINFPPCVQNIFSNTDRGCQAKITVPARSNFARA